MNFVENIKCVVLLKCAMHNNKPLDCLDCVVVNAHPILGYDLSIYELYCGLLELHFLGVRLDAVCSGRMK